MKGMDLLFVKDMANKVSEYLKTLCKGGKLIWKCSYKYSIYFVISNIMLGLYSPVLMLIWKYFLDYTIKAIQNGNKEIMIKAFIFIILHGLIMVIMEGINQLSIYFQDTLKDLLNIYILDMTMDKLSYLSMTHFDMPKLYDKIEKVNNESAERTMSLLTLMVMIIRNITTLIGTIGILTRVNCFFIIICFAASIPIFCVNTKISLKKYNLFNQRLEKMRFVYSLKYLVSKYENIKEIKVFRLGAYIRRKAIGVYTKNLEEDTIIRKEYIKEISIFSIFDMTISYSFKIYVMVKVIIHKLFTLGDMTMFFSAIESLQLSIQNLLKTISEMYINELYIDNFFELMNISVEDDKGESFKNDFKKIVFEDVWFKYPNAETYILKGINCCFEAGKSYCLVGLNGSGKTTLIKLLTRLYLPSKGRILIDGIDIQTYNLQSYYEKISAIFQDFIRYPFNVKQNIGVGRVEEIENSELIGKNAKITKINEFIEKLPNGYETLLQKEWSGGIELSLGQWQKIAITRAYMSNSKIIVLDEPTASLDAEAEYQLYSQLKDLMKNRLCVLISHRLSVNTMVDYVYYMENGSIIESGKHGELLKQDGKYSKYYNMQASAYQSDKR